MLHLGRSMRAAAVLLAAAAGAACRTGAAPTPPPASAAAPPADARTAAALAVLGPPPSGPDDPAVARGILRRAGARIVDGAGQPVRLRGVAFGNQVWGSTALPVRHHGEADFGRVRAMGMNAVRFYMYYGTLEDDRAPGAYKDAGWQWLDRNVAWARKHGVYLVLNMHVPPGGFQSMGEGRGLWETPANQDRLIALWRAVAARYAGEPMIAGYDLLNEPGVTRSKDQWRDLAARIARAIREVDREHILVVERVNSIAKDWKNDAEMNFFVIDDPNVVYTFHFYEPFDYTHQLATWAHMGEGGRYPDETRVSHGPGTKWINIATFDSPKLPPGDTPWTHTESPRLAATDPRAVIGHISLVGQRLGAGRASFDDLVVDEYDEHGARVGEVMRVDIQRSGGWYFWSSNGSGHSGFSVDGHGGPGALTIEATTADANLGGAQHEFAPRPGHAYTVSGWMKGERLPPDAGVQIRLDFLGSDTPVMARDKAFLANQLDRYVAWGRAHHVPLFLGEFGVHRPCFEQERGGLAWVEDMLDLIDERGLSFTYHAYHEDAFGLYPGNGPVDRARGNRGLIELFTRKLAAP
jgi:endoglucanase